MKRNSLLLICLLTSVLGFSQAGYPKKILYPNSRGGYDTVIAITPYQMDAINAMKISYDGCTEINDSLVDIVDSCKSAFILMNSTDRILKRELELKESAIIDRDAVIDSMQTVIKHRERQIVRLKWHRGISGVVNGILGIAIIALLIIK